MFISILPESAYLVWPFTCMRHLFFFKKYKAVPLHQNTGTIFFCNACLYTFYFLLAVNVTVGVLMLLVR